MGERPQPALLARRGEVAHRLGVGAGRVVRHERLAGRSIGDQVERPEHAEAAHLADAGMVGLQLLQSGGDDVGAEHAGVLDDAFFLEDVDARHRRSARQRVTRIGQAAGEGPVAERVGDRLADDDAAERQVAGVDTLGEAHQIGLHAPLLEREPLAATPEAGHHLVADHHDAVPVAALADALQVAVGRHEDAVGADDGLDDDRRDGVAALDHQHVVEVGEGALALLGLAGRVERAAVRRTVPRT